VDDTTESGLPWIDVTLEPAEPFTPSGDYMDEYRCFVLDPQRTEDQYLIGYQVNPGEASEVHHVLLYETDLAEAQALDAEDEESGYLCFGGTNTSSSNMIGGWAPGTPVTEFPTDTGIKVKAGTAVVMQIHYNLANGDPLPDQTSINLQYAHAPVLYPASFEGIFHDDFVIPPYAFDYSSSKTITVDSDITVWGAFPHMHQLGKKIDVTLTHADTNDCLISIPEWDFHWQQLYLYDAPTGVPVYSGDKVKLTCTWSNDTGQTVTWGEGTSDEMCLSYFYVTGQVGE
jgi:hypothetical protein